ncbi:hypothetical protein EZ313_21975 [Ramlibacter henchirensis]|uniref:Uncharacterized protein n=1 Tax=Ramlibacter henchirensis TaxID=204072 RepID=A0A4Z0BLV5_9BURK|nr:hypothetical protein [Ramlibacter henchirensis]TFY99237.1 hypothetical protein EZ313_21975 [Ramlibacter henchirensis]
MNKVKTTELSRPFGQFWPVSVLWEGDGALFPSEQSARWALRAIKRRLAEAGALAYHRGRLQVDPKKVAEIAHELAIEKARQRYSA